MITDFAFPLRGASLNSSPAILVRFLWKFAKFRLIAWNSHVTLVDWCVSVCRQRVIFFLQRQDAGQIACVKAFFNE